MSKCIRMLFLGFAALAATAECGAGRQVTDGKATSGESQTQLKERATQFYQDLLKNDRVSALELVAPDSKNQFLNNKYPGLVDFRIVGVELAPSGDRATVHVVRVVKLPNFGQPLDLDINDTWLRSSEQWYLTLPPPGELDTPFGKMKFNADAKQSNADVEAMRQKIQERYKNVDPDQYLRALRKAEASQATTGAKPADKQTPAEPAPTTTVDDKPKPQP